MIDITILVSGFLVGFFWCNAIDASIHSQEVVQCFEYLPDLFWKVL